MSAGMGMSLTLRPVQRQEQRQEQRLTQAQRLAVEQKLFQTRMQLILAVRDEDYKPRGTCPTCSYELSPIEILRGFNRDPRDFTTACPICGTRIRPQLICVGQSGRVEVLFYCSVQTLDQLSGKEDLQPEQISRRYQAIYRSAIVHFGGLKPAFKKIGIEYPFEDIHDWKSKASPFLGHLPDTIIADCVGVPVSKIRAIRREHDIPRYIKARTLDEIKDAE